jgi:hypothetical protein
MTRVRFRHRFPSVTEAGHVVTFEQPVIEEQLIAQAGTTPRLNRDTQPQIVSTLTPQQGLDLLNRGRCEEHTRRPFGAYRTLPNGLDDL